ncbi:unnamed protein product [Amaranthus hypochondriacus]
MDRYALPLEPSTPYPKLIERPCWKRIAIELDGRIQSKYKRDDLELLVQSYSEIGGFPHQYYTNGSGSRCCTYNDGTLSHLQFGQNRYGISALDFDKQGIYLASVTKSGCLTVYDFESLYCQCNVMSPVFNEDEPKHLLHISTRTQLDTIRWNPGNQDEVACASRKSNEIKLFDISYVSSEPAEILTKKSAVTIHGWDTDTGLLDLAFTSSDISRVYASDNSGSVNIWDRRRSLMPSVELTSNSRNALNSLQLNVDNQVVFGAGKQGMIYIWDLRGGRTAAAFQSHNKAHPPMMSVNISSLLEKIDSLKAQSDIVRKDVHSINLDPSSNSRVAFHLDDGWSGILDIHSLAVTHIHCPPPGWLTHSDMSSSLYYIRRPSWLSKNSIYVVGSASEKGLHLLDFYPDTSSPCHVDCSEKQAVLSRRNGFVPLSEYVSACAVHPLNDYIVAGTQEASLLIIGQQKKFLQGGDEDS